MKAAVWLALAALPAFSQPGGGPVAPFAVYAQFEHEPAAPVLNSLKQELTSVMSAVGWRLEWRSLAGHNNAESFPELAVVTFKGRCDVSNIVAERVETGTLGWTHVMNGEVIPYSEVNCERIRGFLSQSLIDLWPRDRDIVYGRAIARVTAHELYHIFTHTRHHESWGVAEAAFTVRELMADDFTFADDDRRAIAALLQTISPRGAGSPAAGQSVFARSGCTSCHGEKAQGTVRGPALRAPVPSMNINRLASVLFGKATEMYRRARNLKVPWPRLGKSDIDDLLTYLNSSLE